MQYKENYLKWQFATVSIGLAITLGMVALESKHFGVIARDSHVSSAREAETTRMPISFGVSMRTPATTGE